jgi:hypothetical protein
MQRPRTLLHLAALAVLAGAAGCSAAGEGPREVVFTGACDASAAVPLSANLFAVADDEDNVLRVYDADRGGAPLRSVDLSASLFPPQEKKAKKEKKKRGQKKTTKPSDPARAGRARGPESDLEAATRIGDLGFWMTSHGRNRAGKRKDARLLFFATTAAGADDPLRLVGRGYGGLLDDLLADPRYAEFGLAAAAEVAPKEPGGLNLEGLGERPEGGVWIGLRSPVPGGRALLAPLLNPERVAGGERAQLGDPVQLDLGGLGVRSLSRWRGRVLVVAGPPAGAGASRLFAWDGRGAPAPVPDVDLGGLNPEGFFSPEEREEILLLSDDGALEVDGEECKRLDDPARKRFRGRWIGLPSERAGVPAAPAGRAGV